MVLNPLDQYHPSSKRLASKVWNSEMSWNWKSLIFLVPFEHQKKSSLTLVGSFNQFEKWYSNLIISPARTEHKNVWNHLVLDSDDHQNEALHFYMVSKWLEHDGTISLPLKRSLKISKSNHPFPCCVLSVSKDGVNTTKHEANRGCNCNKNPTNLVTLETEDGPTKNCKYVFSFNPNHHQFWDSMIQFPCSTRCLSKRKKCPLTWVFNIKRRIASATTQGLLW